MSCWVVPSVAAELWGISLDKVLASIRSGAVPARTEFGFTLIDVAPHSPTLQPLHRPHALQPLTYSEIPAPRVAVQASSQQTDQIPLGAADDHTQSNGGDLSWLNIRNDVGRLRHGPARAA